MLIVMKEVGRIHFTGFYGHPELSQQYLSWEFLREISGRVYEEWIVG